LEAESGPTASIDPDAEAEMVGRDFADVRSWTRSWGSRPRNSFGSRAFFVDSPTAREQLNSFAANVRQTAKRVHRDWPNTGCTPNGRPHNI